LDRAIQAASRLAQLEKYKIREYPETKTPIEQLVEKLMNAEDREEAVSTSVLKSELGELYPMYRSLRDLRNAKGIQARLPYELVVF